MRAPYTILQTGRTPGASREAASRFARRLALFIRGGKLPPSHIWMYT
jgi:hypothetical protein